MRASWENLVQRVGNKYRQDISNDLNNKIKVKIVTPVHATQVLVRHSTPESTGPHGTIQNPKILPGTGKHV